MSNVVQYFLSLIIFVIPVGMQRAPCRGLGVRGSVRAETAVQKLEGNVLGLEYTP